MSRKAGHTVILALGSVNFNRQRIHQAHTYGASRQGSVDYVVSGGSSVLEATAANLTGAAEMARYLVQMGVPQSAILTEDTSTTTVQNITYSVRRYGTQLKRGKLIVFCGPEQILLVRKLLRLLDIPQATFRATEQHGSFLMRLRYWWTAHPVSLTKIIRRDEQIVRLTTLFTKSPRLARFLKI